MKELFDEISIKSSKLTTKAYSTSFSLGIYCLHRSLQNPIYAIYGFVRFADEIVDSFHDYNKRQLFDEFKADTWKAIERGISLNPILNSFQQVVKQYSIDQELIVAFLNSMEADLDVQEHSEESYKHYILGSAESVGLMCLHVFSGNDKALYDRLKPSAMKLGAAFQKVNFLRDLSTDYKILGRVYFPNVNFESFKASDKLEIEADIDKDFADARAGIILLPRSARYGVYLAYIYYLNLYRKIKRTPVDLIFHKRIRISNFRKFTLMLFAYIRYIFGAL
jgi:15-cis-phytoene synthase